MRRRTLSHASRKGHRTSSHNGGIRSDTTRSLAIAALLPQSLDPTSVLTFNALQCFVQRSNWILEMYYFSKCPLREPDHKIVPFCLWLLSWPTRLLPFEPPGRGPHLSGSMWLTCNHRLRGLHFFSPQCQLIRALPDNHIRAPFRSLRLPNFKRSRASAWRSNIGRP